MAKFQLRYCPALAKKPKDNTKGEATKSKSRSDPFAEPSPDLLIVTGKSHLLVLNKYPVIPNHFILATKADKPQTHLLETEDLAAAYSCLTAWNADNGEGPDGQLFAFFNSGEHSGASQPHRHIQFLPVRDMRSNNSKWELPETFDWNPLILSMTSNYHESAGMTYTTNARLGIRHFAVPLQTSTSLSLHEKYIRLLKMAVSASKASASSFIEYDENTEIDAEGETVISYNLAMTSEIMAIWPRHSEAAQIPELNKSHTVAINGTILAGTLMVKEEEEWNVLRNTPGAIDHLLQEISFQASMPDQPTISANTIPGSVHL